MFIEVSTRNASLSFRRSIPAHNHDPEVSGCQNHAFFPFLLSESAKRRDLMGGVYTELICLPFIKILKTGLTRSVQHANSGTMAPKPQNRTETVVV